MATYYFAQHGNDTTGDGSVNAPYRTIAKAQALHAVGDTLLFAGNNTWTGETLAITKANVTVGSYGAAKANFNNTTDCLSVATAANVAISGIAFNNAARSILLSGAVGGLVVSNCSFNLGAKGISGESATGAIIVRDCLFTDQTANGVIHNSSLTSEIYNCSFYRIATGAVAASSTSTTTVHNCYFYECTRDFQGTNTAGTNIFYSNFSIATDKANAFIQSGGGSMTFYNNILIALGNPSAATIRTVAGTLKLYNNTLISRASNGTNVLASSAAAVTFTNNLSLIRKGLHISVDTTAHGGTSTLSADYNCYFPTGLMFSYGTTVDFPTWQVDSDQHGKAEQPYIINRESPSSPADARLQEASPCINAGTDLSAILTTDYFGETRSILLGQSFDIGAVEFFDETIFTSKNVVRSPHDGNSYFYQDRELWFVISTVENRTSLLVDGIVPSSALPVIYSTLTEKQINIIKAKLGDAV